MKVSRIKLLLLGLMTLFIIALVLAVYTDNSIRSQVREKRFLVPTKYYSSPKKFFLGQVYSLDSFEKHFDDHHYRKREFGSPMSQGDYAVGNQEQCEQVIDTKKDVYYCITFRSRFGNELFYLSLNELDQLNAIYSGEQLSPALFAEAEAGIFAQYLGNKPTLQMHTPLGEIPRYCLEAVLAIEDPYFLEHRGVSLRGILRAFIANILNARWSQGGSTITQQLVKNYFLTPEKTISRKIKEILISFIFEFRVSKDDILETYLNIIYLGQSGVFEVRGYKAASEHYFQKPLTDLNLSECALLAAIVNSPGRYNPITHPERAKERRLRVLNKMKEHNMVLPEEFDEALGQPLPTQFKTQIAASAPYYVDAVKKRLYEKGFDDLYGLSVYTALDPEAQSLAEKAVRNGINYFENHVASIKKLKEEQGLHLQAALLSSNPISGEITAIVGGRNFSSSPFNRAIESQRQVGSVFKPIVYLTAIKNADEMGAPYTPVTLINNSPFKYEYEGQVWEPQNYHKDFSAPLPLFFALKESVNVPTARLATSVGLDKIIDTAREIGIKSPLKEYPSISLGAFELNPLEVLQAYNTISQMGEKQDLRILKKVTDQAGNILHEETSIRERVGNIDDYAVLVGMMKETLTSGTGAYSRKMGFNHIAAGKTGTTSDTKDAWFAGFTPFHVAITWVGYDQAQSHGLTGASGALPIWTNYMRDISKKYSNLGFIFPETVHKETLSAERLQELGVPQEKAKETELYFKND